MKETFHPVHRLDRGTSGLLAVAKPPPRPGGAEGAAPHPRPSAVTYLAVCDGGASAPPSGVIDAPLGPWEGSLVEQMVRPDGKDARTRYETLSRTGGPFAWLRLELDTGRTHQIRVHMASLGCPLTGDFLYGYRGPFPDLPPCPPLRPAVPPAARHWAGAVLYPPPSGGYGAPADPSERREGAVNVIRRWITQPNALLRAAALFGAGMALTLAAACLSWPLLPEGLLKNANPLWNWAVSSRPLVGGLQIFGFNLIFACVLVGANLFARGPQGGPLIPCGYSCLLLLFLLYGLMVGTWSFQMGGEAPPFAARLLRMLHISEASGMVEMSAFCCIASGTADISFVQTLGGRTTAGRLRDIRLSRQDGLVLALGFLLLFAAAMIEAASILRLT